MLGRFEYKPTQQHIAPIARHFGARSASRLLMIREAADVVPTEPVAIIRRRLDEPPEVVQAYWGSLRTAPALRIASPSMIGDTPVEMASESPVWRDLWMGARCIIPATGWYQCIPHLDPETGETVTDPVTQDLVKRRYALRCPFGNTIAFAGLYSTRPGRDGQSLVATILTREAPAGLAWLHDRMPCCLPESHWSSWLNPTETDSDAILRILDHAHSDFRVTEAGRVN